MEKENETKKVLIGIDGWLVLFQIHIIGHLCSYIVGIFEVIVNNKLYEQEAGINLLLTYIGNGVAIALLGFCVVFFYRRRITFRIFYIFYAIIGALLYIINAAIVLKGIWLGAFIIITLTFFSAFVVALFKSQRVKNTFANKNIKN